MKNVKQICQELAAKVKREIEQAIEFDYYSATVEEQYGTASIQVYCHLEERNGWMIPETDITIFHDDDSHKSPLLEEAIRKAIPSWEQVEMQIEKRKVFSIV